MSRNIQPSKSKSISFIISSHLSQFRRIHKIYPTNLSLEKLLTPPNTKPPRKKTFSLRPPNGFILYRKDVQREIMNNNSDVTFKTVSAIASKKWKCESVEKKNFFNSLSRVAHLVYLDICEIHVENNKEHKNLNLQKEDEKNLKRPWLQSSTFPTMLVSPLHCEKNVKDNSQEIDNDKFNQSFFKLQPQSCDILDINQPMFNSNIPFSPNVDSANYCLEIPYISDFLLNSNNDNVYQISQECKPIYENNENNDYLYIFNNHNSYFSGINDETF